MDHAMKGNDILAECGIFADDMFSADLFDCPEQIVYQDEFPIAENSHLPMVINAWTRENSPEVKEVKEVKEVPQKPIYQKTIDELLQICRDLQKEQIRKNNEPRRPIVVKRKNGNDFWSTLPMMGVKDVLPSEVVFPNKFSTAGKCLQTALLVAKERPNEWHARISLKPLFGTQWSNVKKHLTGKNRNYLELGDEPQNNSFLIAKFNRDWQFILWNPQ
jgi:hypothetical protein